jgi:RNA polymerase sigma-70 factor, ECF subfamily
MTPDEFIDLTRPHLSKMGRLAERLSGTADRDDVLQETLVRAWLKRHQYDPLRGSLSAWLMAITADQARRLRRRRRPLHATPPSPSSGEDDRLDIELAVERLPARQRLAVDCYYFVGLSVAETAEVMRCSQGTVKSTLANARRNLRIHLRPRT